MKMLFEIPLDGNHSDVRHALSLLDPGVLHY
jgi:hypothetical protein